MIDDLAQQLLKDINKFFDSGKATAEAAFSGQQLKPIIENALKKMDLVTREEFDAQQAVLLRTREMLAALEAQVAELEAKADPKPRA